MLIIYNKIISLAEIYIPNKEILVRQSDLPWITTNIKRMIRKRKRLYRKAKLTNNNAHWVKFRNFRNDVISAIRTSKKEYHEGISNKLKSGQLCSNYIKTFHQ